MFHARLCFLFFPVVVCSLLFSCFIAKAQTVKPDRLVYVSNRDYPNIYAMNGDGTVVKRLTNSKRIEIDPSWSPDRQRILFVTIEEDKTSLSIFDTKLSKQTRLYQARPGASIFGPMWSPNGLTVFFSQSGTSSVAPFNLYRMDADGKNVKSLGAGVLPSIAPDGKTLLYTSMESGGKIFNLNLMDIEGANARTLVQNAIGGAWSPDGKYIAYISTVPPGGVTIAKADGTEPRSIVPVTTPHIPCRPVWSRDGKRLYFSRIPVRDDGSAKRDICVVDVTGKNFKRLTDDSFDNELGEGTSFFAILKQASDKARASKGP